MIYEYDNRNEHKVNRNKSEKYKGKRILFSYAMIMLLLNISVFFLNDIEMRADVESFQFTESALNLKNPNRGFYQLYTFWILDEETNYKEIVEKIGQNDIDTELILVKICLQNYREDIISENGLENIKKLFCALESLDKQLIVRFIYDDEGKIEQYEPKSMDIILQHMKQLQPVFSEYGKQIFIMQGLFTGNWGEMNGTRYSTAEDMGRLAVQLSAVTDESIYLAVRTPGQWRSIIRSDSPSKEILQGNRLAACLSLFNDGLLGNRSDYGTYKIEDNDEDDLYGRWNREEELVFQEELCCYVPNGGEVINDNPYNDFDKAVKGLAERHITYLNKDYDKAVLEKWEKEIVTEKNCFYGMDGYNYIERHLGYRLLITETNLEYKEDQKCIVAEVSLKNVGFAPLYKEPQINVVLYNEDKSELLSKEMSCNVRKLVGGEKSEMQQTAYAEIPITELSKLEYAVYFFIEDIDSGRHIMLANEQKEEKYGYCIGTVKVY